MTVMAKKESTTTRVAVIVTDDDFKIIATGPCEVTVLDLIHTTDVTRDATVVTDEQFDASVKHVRDDFETDPDYTPDGIYETELSTDAVINLIRKRGGNPHIVLDEDQCGDDTATHFNDHVANGSEVMQVTLQGWMLFRSDADRTKFEETHDDPYGYRKFDAVVNPSKKKTKKKA